MKECPNQEQEAALDRVFAALADRTRRAILCAVSRKTCSVGELAAPHDMSLPAISKHLKILEKAGLLTKEKDGRVYRCDINVGPLGDAADIIQFYRSFWERRFDGLVQFFDDLEQRSQKQKERESSADPDPQSD